MPEDIDRPLTSHPRYELTDYIRCGTSGSVWIAVDKHLKKEVAIKFIARSHKRMKYIEREILNQRLCLLHPHIVQFQEVFSTPTHLAIVMEYAAGRDFVDYLKRYKSATGTRVLGEEIGRYFFQQLMSAVEFCHRMHVVVRDIKLDNLLVDSTSLQTHLKLCDFGYSKDSVVHSQCDTLCGSPDYIAPEVMSRAGAYDGAKADIWSCGVVLYIMVSGRFPFWRKEDQNLNAVMQMQRALMRIQAGDYDIPEHLSASCQDILRCMLTVDPTHRISAVDVLHHPWYTEELPPQLQDINDRLLAMPLDRRLAGVDQTEADVIATVRTAAGMPVNHAQGDKYAAAKGGAPAGAQATGGRANAFSNAKPPPQEVKETTNHRGGRRLFPCW